MGETQVALYNEASATYLSLDETTHQATKTARVSAAARFIVLPLGPCQADPSQSCHSFALWSPVLRRFLRMAVGASGLDAGDQHDALGADTAPQASETFRAILPHEVRASGEVHLPPRVGRREAVWFVVTPDSTLVEAPPLPLLEAIEVARATVPCSGELSRARIAIPANASVNSSGAPAALQHLRGYVAEVRAYDKAGNLAQCIDGPLPRGRRSYDGLSQRAVLVDATPPHPANSGGAVWDLPAHQTVQALGSKLERPSMAF